MTQPRDRGRGPFAPADSSDPTTGQRDPWFFDPPAAASRESAGVETAGPPYDGGVPIAPTTAVDADDGMTPSERFYVRAQNLRREAREMDRAMQSVARTGKPAGSTHPATGARWDYEGWTAGDFRAERDRLESEADRAVPHNKAEQTPRTIEGAPSWVHRAQFRPRPAPPQAPPPPVYVPRTDIQTSPPPALPPSAAPVQAKPEVPQHQPLPPVGPLVTPADDRHRGPQAETFPGVQPAKPEALIFVPTFIPSYPLNDRPSQVTRKIPIDSPETAKEFTTAVGKLMAQSLVLSMESATGGVNEEAGRLGAAHVREFNKAMEGLCIAMACQAFGSGVKVEALTARLAAIRGRPQGAEPRAPGPHGLKGGSYADGGFVIGDTWFVFNSADTIRRFPGFTAREMRNWKRLLDNFQNLNKNTKGRLVDKPTRESWQNNRAWHLYQAERACEMMISEAEVSLYSEDDAK